MDMIVGLGTLCVYSLGEIIHVYVYTHKFIQNYYFYSINLNIYANVAWQF